MSIIDLIGRLCHRTDKKILESFQLVSEFYFAELPFSRNLSSPNSFCGTTPTANDSRNHRAQKNDFCQLHNFSPNPWMQFQNTHNETPVIVILHITHAANISSLLGNVKATLTALKAFFVV
jgi:hypothetical protein